MLTTLTNALKFLLIAQEIKAKLQVKRPRCSLCGSCDEQLVSFHWGQLLHCNTATLLSLLMLFTHFGRSFSTAECVMSQQAGKTGRGHFFLVEEKKLSQKLKPALVSARGLMGLCS